MSEPLTRALLVLTFVTGIVDAVSFLALEQVFAAMQTGNVIFLGFGIGGADGLPVLAPLTGLVAFFAGGAFAALVGGEATPQGHGLRRAMVAEIALLAAAAAFAAATDPAPEQLAAYVLVATLSFAMGLRNTMVKRAGSPNLATTVLNLTLTPVAALPGAGVASGGDLAQRAGGLLALLAGAAAGALLLEASLALPLAAAAALTLVAALILSGRDRHAVKRGRSFRAR